VVFGCVVFGCGVAVFGGCFVDEELLLAPHSKTTMSPQIFAEQLGHGAWGMTAATANQVQVMHAYGVKRVVMANQLLGKANIEAIGQILAADPEFDFYCFVDSVAQLNNLPSCRCRRVRRRGAGPREGYRPYLQLRGLCG
jgi:D-serine deaminase-like pyridoxal phosphate-dependent protein